MTAAQASSAGRHTRGSQPNILWVSVEDINPLLGCYGDSCDSVHDVQYRFPMERAVAAIEGSTAYYRWPEEP